MPSSSISLRSVARIAGVARAMKRLWAAMTWSGPRHDSLFLLFIGWPAMCLYYDDFLVYVFPLAFFIKNPHEQDADKRLEQAQDTLSWIESLVNYRDGLSNNGLLVLVVLWYSLNLFYPTRIILLVIGTLCIAGASPWMCNRWPVILLRSFWVVLHGTRRENQDDDTLSLTQRVEEFQKHHMQSNTAIANFEFALYENQRSWPLAGWKPQTFTFIDRAVWTDTAKKPTLSKNLFELPETINAGEKTWVWIWIDDDWSLDQRVIADELGWQYGTPFWSLFDLTPKGWLSTRRRRWIRTASLRSSPGQPIALTSPTSLRTRSPSSSVRSVPFNIQSLTPTPQNPASTSLQLPLSPISPSANVSDKKIVSMASSTCLHPQNMSTVSLELSTQPNASTVTIRKSGKRESSTSWRRIVVGKHRDHSNNN
ncbi:integral peroxisomal membrane peroxin-domain-containing protein [Dichotomocladium elegans]|nr:integral peroxisomal membrane peroxin-domain-containing protein [Dichotomocladium elegans]